MIVSISSYITILMFEPHSIYSMRLAQKGELLTHHKDRAVLTLLRADSVIEKDFQMVSPEIIDQYLPIGIKYLRFRHKADIMAILIDHRKIPRFRIVKRLHDLYRRVDYDLGRGETMNFDTWKRLYNSGRNMIFRILSRQDDTQPTRPARPQQGSVTPASGNNLYHIAQRHLGAPSGNLSRSRYPPVTR